ncbi:hypothetical protein BN1723_020162 [Verticillium longisporum]|uniref:Uncharacterized protein n=1 Tax=Verticillium longisporum TaxID=100787 RepID=A0A0G4NKA7_VERLO|nr:hypothetical protein BN1723_020162 [Verticillium longisporum]
MLQVEMVGSRKAYTPTAITERLSARNDTPSSSIRQ